LASQLKPAAPQHKVPNKSDIVCYKCGEVGHISSRCPPKTMKKNYLN
jgi:hypothetical protein